MIYFRVIQGTGEINKKYANFIWDPHFLLDKRKLERVWL